MVDDSVFYLHPSSESRLLDIKSIAVMTASGKGGWRTLGKDRIDSRGSQDYRINLPSGKNRPKAVKVRILGQSGWNKEEHYAPLSEQSNPRFNLSYRLADGGIYFEIGGSSLWSFPPQVGIVYDDGYIGKIETSPRPGREFVAFYYNPAINSRIIRLDLYYHDAIVAAKDVSVTLAGKNKEWESFPINSEFQVSYDSNNFYEPVYLEVMPTGRLRRQSKDIFSAVYDISPEIQPLANPITVSMKYNGPDLKNIGLCRATDNGWQWMKPEHLAGRLSVKSNLLGTFALMKDDEPPQIYFVSPGDRKISRNSLPEIRIRLTDNFSGIEDDRDILVSVDGRWLIPEYDPERGILSTSPDQKLGEGGHQLDVRATDAAGNSSTLKAIFYVRTGKGAGKR